MIFVFDDYRDPAIFKIPKELLREQILRAKAIAEAECQSAFARGDIFAGLAWGWKIPVFDELVASIRRLAYETGPAVADLAADVVRTTEMIDPRGDLKRSFFKDPPKSKEAGTPRAARLGQHSHFVPGSIGAVREAVMQAAKDAVPVGCSPREALRIVAESEFNVRIG